MPDWNPDKLLGLKPIISAGFQSGITPNIILFESEKLDLSL